MARSDTEIELLWHAYQAAGDFNQAPNVKEVLELFQEDWRPVKEIPFDRWLKLIIQSMKLEPIDNIKTITDDGKVERVKDIAKLTIDELDALYFTRDEVEALYFTSNIDRSTVPSGKMRRYIVAAALFNNQLDFDRKHGRRMLEKKIGANSLMMALRRANKL